MREIVKGCSLMKLDASSVTIVWSDEVQAFVIFELFLFVLWLAGYPVRFSIGKRHCEIASIPHNSPWLHTEPIIAQSSHSWIRFFARMLGIGPARLQCHSVGRSLLQIARAEPRLRAAARLSSSVDLGGSANTNARSRNCNFDQKAPQSSPYHRDAAVH